MALPPLPDLPSSSPSRQGVDARGILALVEALESTPGVEPHSLVVLRHGVVIAAGWWAPYTSERPHLLYSLSKSFTSTALGFAVAEGLVGLDDRVLDHLPEFADAVPPGADGERVRGMLVRHVAAMASGHDRDTWDEAVRADPAEPLRGFLALPLAADPGTLFAYNQPATYAVATIVQRLTGQTLLEYLRPRLLDPLGIGETGWQEHPAGRQMGFSGLHAPTEAVAKLAQLYLDDGRWGGRQLLPDGWVAEATRAHVANPDEENIDWRQGYGFQFWRARHGYRGDGAYGQFAIVLPEADVAVAMTGQSTDMQAVLDAVWTHLLPAAGQEGAQTSAAADAELADRLSSLALPVPGAVPSSGSSVTPAVESQSWVGGSFTPAGGRCAAQPSLERVRVQTVPGHEGGRVELVEGAGAVTARWGWGSWVVEEAPGPDGSVIPTAASAHWVAPGRLQLDVVFLETPHRLVLTGDLASAEFDAAWVTTPLRAGALAELHCPR